jgi:heme/copper-type cytochrome/quinol oxidase subunit 2
MIKKAILIILPIIVIVGLFYYKMQSGKSMTDIKNEKKIALKIIPNKIQDPQCRMYLSGDDFAVQIITSDYKTHFFDDPGCAILWMNGNKINPKNTVIWAYSMDSKKWIDAKKAYFSISDFETPMHYGFGVHEKDKKGYINFNEMRLRMLRGENMTNPKIRKKILKDQK